MNAEERRKRLPHIARYSLRYVSGTVWALYPYRGATRPITLCGRFRNICRAARRQLERNQK